MKIFHVRFNNSWFQYFNLKATTRGLRGGVLPAHHTPPHPTLLHLAALCVFDFVLGNGDRSPVKNNFVVGGGLLRSTGDKDFLLHPNHPTFVYLDQGSSLRKSYLERNPIAQSHLAFSRGEEDTFCLFHGPLLRRIHQLAAQVPAPKMRKKLGNRSSGGGATESLFVNMLRRRLPPEVLLVIGGVKLAECGARLKELLGVADRCLSDERIQGIVLFP
uniref:Uncharacterized protein TCIL3000_7_1230 n=1 Tax=Trypanosoma congolense (strain IL3000) TaxID=1068625 RepID=G0UPK8_TRYCI|nr:unnamed protein product [Trypanosoma congolense IL3000]